MQLEPSDPSVLARPSALSPVRLAAGAGGLALLLVSSGDAFFLAAALGVATASGVVGATVALVATSMLAAWGTTALDAVAGAQAVLGPAGLVEPAAIAAAAWVAGVACVVVAGCTERPGSAALLGLTAGLVVAGPSGSRPEDLAIRLGAAIVGVALAGVALRWLPRRLAATAGPAAGVAACLLGWSA